MRVLLLMLLLASGPIQAAGVNDGDHRFYGYAYKLGSQEYLYTEVHQQTIANDRWVRGAIRYYDPEGILIAEKTLDYTQDPYIPVFTLDVPGRGYSEAITAVSEQGIEMSRVSRGKGERVKTFPRETPMAADSGFHSYLCDHFEALLAGESVDFNFAVAGNLATYRFRARKTGEVTVDGVEAITVRVEPDSLLRLLAPPLDLTYDPATLKLIEYQGLSNLHDPATGRAYNVRIVYPAEPPSDAPQPLPPLDPAA